MPQAKCGGKPTNFLEALFVVGFIGLRADGAHDGDAKKINRGHNPQPKDDW